MKKIIFSVLLLCFLPVLLSAQHENVELINPVYDYLKIMSVKKIITSIHDDNPNMSRKEISDFLAQISEKENELSKVEKGLLKKYTIEFVDDEESRNNTYSFLGGNVYPKYPLSDFFSDKKKYIYAYERNENTFFADVMGHLNPIGELKPNKMNSWLFDGGFRVRGTFFDHLGYYFSLIKGGATGSPDLAKLVDPRLIPNFKFNEHLENLRNYDFHEAYLRYYAEPSEGMKLSLQFGREPIKFGHGYGNSMTLSGLGPVMDFFKFGFTYGVVNYSSIHASTVGNFGAPADRYTKYFAANRLQLSFDDVLDVGIMESMIYSGRGLEFAYLPPIVFYKFAEMSIQDRDNGALGMDLQTHFLKNAEFQFSFFMDENPIGNLQDLNMAKANKTGYQIGAFFYEPLKIPNLSFVLEYTRIRPYTYTHENPENTYTAYGVILGHSIGPNADQVYSKLNYNLSSKLSFFLEYQHIRKGKNIVDASGNLIKNVGGDAFTPYREGIDSPDAFFLDGIRFNTDILGGTFRFEPIRGFTFDINLTYSRENNITANIVKDMVYSYLRFSLEY
jgi:hypothetical protein